MEGGEVGVPLPDSGGLSDLGLTSAVVLIGLSLVLGGTRPLLGVARIFNHLSVIKQYLSNNNQT